MDTVKRRSCSVSKLELSFKTKKLLLKNTIVNGYYTFIKPASSSFVRKLFSRAAAVLENDGFDDRKKILLQFKIMRRLTDQ
jgi:hypothetical protein